MDSIRDIFYIIEINWNYLKKKKKTRGFEPCLFDDMTSPHF